MGLCIALVQVTSPYQPTTINPNYQLTPYQPTISIHPLTPPSFHIPLSPLPLLPLPLLPPYGSIHCINSGHRKGSLVPPSSSAMKGLDSRDSRGSGGSGEPSGGPSGGPSRGGIGTMGGVLHMGTLAEKLERLSEIGVISRSHDQDHHHSSHHPHHPHTNTNNNNNHNHNNNNHAPMLSEVDRKGSIMSEYSEESGLTHTSPREKNTTGDPPCSSLIYYP